MTHDETHWTGCWEVHSECAKAEVRRLQKITQTAKEYQTDTGTLQCSECGCLVGYSSADHHDFWHKEQRRLLFGD